MKQRSLRATFVVGQERVVEGEKENVDVKGDEDDEDGRLGEDAQDVEDVADGETMQAFSKSSQTLKKNK